MFVFVKQMTAYELRISDWSATCALPICAYARAVDLPEAEIGAAVRQELEDDEYGSRPLYEAYEPTDPARLPTARLTWTLVIVTLLLASAYGVWRFLSVEPDEALIAAQNRAADESEAPQRDAGPAPVTKAGAAAVAATAPGSEERRVGEACVRRGRTRG